MTALRNQVVAETLDQVRIVYVDRATAKWWNSRKKPSDTATFTGFYWIKDNEEAGPFKTRSAAIRDAYYRFVLHRETPSVQQAIAKERVLRPDPNRKRGRPPQQAYYA